MRKSHESLLFDIAYNTGGVPIAAGILYLFLRVLLSHNVEAPSKSLSPVSFIGNAFRSGAQKL